MVQNIFFANCSQLARQKFDNYWSYVSPEDFSSQYWASSLCHALHPCEVRWVPYLVSKYYLTPGKVLVHYLTVFSAVLWIHITLLRIQMQIRILTFIWYGSRCQSGFGFLFDEDADSDTTFLPDADPDPDPSFQIKAQTLEQVLK